MSIVIALVSNPGKSHAKPCDDSLVQTSDGQRWPLEINLGSRGIFSSVTFHGEDSDNEFTESTFKLRALPSFGVFAGAISAKDLYQWRAGIVFDFSYMTKGAGVAVNDRNVGSIDQRYFDLSSLVRLERALGRRLHGYLVGGPRFSFLRDATLVSSDGSRQDLTAATRDRDIGLVAGAGVGWNIHPQHRILLDTRIDIGFQTIDISVNNTEFKNLAVSLSLGYQWSYPPRAVKAVACPDS